MGEDITDLILSSAEYRRMASVQRYIFFLPYTIIISGAYYVSESVTHFLMIIYFNFHYNLVK